ncbi:hypothetical protein LCGC14_2634480 [marine sediment metagenome]|uniref:Uncharacterized protein n=1 Tax=marine sediment metagenome TaxID=412755 RepID=A0A0F9CA80_9ZZZZ
MKGQNPRRAKTQSKPHPSQIVTFSTAAQGGDRAGIPPWSRYRRQSAEGAGRDYEIPALPIAAAPCAGLTRFSSPPPAPCRPACRCISARVFLPYYLLYIIASFLSRLCRNTVFLFTFFGLSHHQQHRQWNRPNQ